MKKFLAMALAVIMMLALAIPAMAEDLGTEGNPAVISKIPFFCFTSISYSYYTANYSRHTLFIIALYYNNCVFTIKKYKTLDNSNFLRYTICTSTVNTH